MQALRTDPWRLFAVDHRPGAALRGTVTKVLPFGIIVRVAPGVQGLLPDHTGEPGEEIIAALHKIDWARRRLVLGPAH